MSCYAVVVAAGIGKRMGADKSKQYLLIDGKPILAHTLLRIAGFDFIDGIVLVMRKDDEHYCINDVVVKYNIGKITNVVEGGELRQDSVYNGLKSLNHNHPDFVMVHDGVRPFFSNSVFRQVFDQAKECCAAIAAVPVVCTVKESVDGVFVSKTIPRDKLWEVQTPQGFSYSLIRSAYDYLYSKEKNMVVTDEAMAVEIYGGKVRIVEGNTDNIKITSPIDIKIAEKILSEGRYLN